MFYVSPDEFATFADELSVLAGQSGGSNPRLRRDELLDRAVIRFVDEKVLDSPSATAVAGRRPRDQSR